MYRMVAWHAGSVCFPSPNQRANSARWTLQIPTRQRRRGHPSRPLWRTRRQGRVKVLQYEFPQARRGRSRTGWVPSGRRGGRSRGRGDGQRWSRPWDSRRGGSTSSGWTRGPAGPEAIINSRWLGASGGGCSSTRPSGKATRRRQGNRRCWVALWRRGGRGWIGVLGGVGSL